MGEVPDRLTAALSGRYAIEREVGAGGMATVYLARDLKHDRRVALKVLRPELAAVMGADRFLAEIRTTANLQHPHILALFDSGQTDGFVYYVMPYVEGESLRARLDREKQLPVAEAVRIGTAVAQALDYAHRHGVIHRDVKPENVLLHDGEPVVADFGIALAVSAAGGGRLTETGLSLGTPYYMSPEQASADRDPGPASDVYSLGCVVYEMLAGDPPHTGSTAQAVLAKILTEDPRPVSVLRRAVPAHVEGALARALERLPADRFETADAFARALRDPGFHHHTVSGFSSAGRATGRSWRVPAVATFAVAVLLMAIGLFFRPNPVPAGPPSLLEISLPEGVDPPSDDLARLVTLSRDGSQLAFGTREGGFVRRMNSNSAVRPPGDDGWVMDFSPDGTWILMAEGRGLVRVPTAGGAAEPVADSAGAFGASWGEGDRIVFSQNDALWYRGPDAEPGVLAIPDADRQHLSYRWPDVLPGGEAALITLYKGAITGETAELGVLNLADGVVTELGIEGTNPRFVAAGGEEIVLFARSDGTLFALPFSLRRLRPSGPPVAILDGIRVGLQGVANYSASDNGTIVYFSGGVASGRLVMVDRDGVARPVLDEARPFAWPRLSPDGRRIAVAIGPPYDIWVYDRTAGTLTRLTTDGNAQYPEWSPDGTRIAYAASGGGAVRWQPWDGSGAEETLIPASPPVGDIAFGPAGSFAAVRRGMGASGENQDVWVAPLDSLDAWRPLADGPANETLARVSPDGELIAYTAGPNPAQVFVRPLRGSQGRLQVSTDGGDQPVWSRDGRDIVYRGFPAEEGAPGYLMSAAIARSPELAVVRRDSLFAELRPRVLLHANFDVAPNGDVLTVQPAADERARLFAHINWLEEMRQQLRRAPD